MLSSLLRVWYFDSGPCDVPLSTAIALFRDLSSVHGLTSGNFVWVGADQGFDDDPAM